MRERMRQSFLHCDAAVVAVAAAAAAVAAAVPTYSYLKFGYRLSYVHV